MANILVIEDSNDINEMICDLLREEHKVYPAFSGTEGLLLFKTETIDLVLLDIMLPGKNGAEVLKEIRMNSEVPVIMLTALGDKKRITEYLLNGANDYVTKPFDLDELYARVTVQLRSSQSSSDNERNYQHKKITLDTATFEIYNGTEALRLGKKEFDIFQCLLEHPKRVFTKEQLYETVWDEMYYPTDNTLNTHLSNLRKKLAQLDQENEYIETIWGLGVRLSEDKKC